MGRVIYFALFLAFSVSAFAFEPVAMDVAAFVDTTPQGPVNKAVLITSLEQFEETYIGYNRKLRDKNRAYLQVRQYFLNGGTRAWFNRVLLPKDRQPLAKDIIGDPAFKTGIYAFTESPQFSMLVIPALNTLNKKEARIAREASLSLVQSLKAFLIMDTPVSKDFNALIKWRDNTPDLGGPLNNYAALYYPQILVQDSFIGPSGSVAGIYAKTPVWNSTANIEIQGAKKLESKIEPSQQNELNKPANGIGINSIQEFPNYGLRVWGAKTLDINSADWRYINMRRTISMIERSIHQGLKAYKFAPNNADTWVLVKAEIQNFLLQLWLQGAIQGAKAEDGFDVKVGLGSTMTPEDILDGRMVVKVQVAFNSPGEFILMIFEESIEHGILSSQ